MRAIHLPGNLLKAAKTTSSSSSKTPTCHDLAYSLDLPPPELPTKPTTHETTRLTPHQRRAQYLLEVIATSPTRGELTWPEVLDESRMKGEHGPIPGHDVVGRVVARKSMDVGNQSDDHTTGNGKLVDGFEFAFDEGNIVYGLIDFDRDGAATDHVAVWEGEVSRIPKLPRTLDDAVWLQLLSTIPLAGLTAWQALFEHGGIAEPVLLDSDTKVELGTDSVPTPRRVLITGASGAVGLLAIQLAHRASSISQIIHITAICSSTHSSEVELLGADVVLCHDKDEQEVLDGIKSQGPFDLILDLAGPPMLYKILSFFNSQAFTEDINEQQDVKFPGSKIVSITIPFSHSEAEEINASQQIEELIGQRYKFFIVRPDSIQLDKISKLLEIGQLQSFVQKVFALEDGVKATEECERRGRKELGKVVIQVS